MYGQGEGLRLVEPSVVAFGHPPEVYLSTPARAQRKGTTLNAL